MTIVVKIGSAVLTDEDKGVNKEVLLEIIRQISELKRRGNAVLIVTSGAISGCLKKQYSKSLRAACGQPKLVALYSEYFSIFGFDVAQFLYTHEDLEGERKDYTKNILFEAIKNGVVPVINANDSVSGVELDALKKFADNDILAQEVALLIGAEEVMVLINKDGLIDFKSNKVIRVVSNEKKALELAEGVSDSGTGGMASKIKVAGFLSKNGIKVRLIPGRSNNSILDAFDGKKIGTVCNIKK